MLSPERRDLLVSHLREVGSARTADLVDLLGVSDVTVRRDVDRLVREGRARRFHGGVSLAAEADREARSPIPSGLHLGVLVPASSYFRAVMAGVSEVAARLGVRLSLALSWYQPDQDLAAVRRLLKDGVDGLLLAPPPDADGCALMDAELRSLPVPVVLLERRLKSDVLIDGLDHVVSDHATGAGLAVQHLAAMGHRRVALVVKDSGPTARAVQAGHSRAVSALGLADDLPVLSVPQFNEQVHGIDQRYEEAVTSLRQARASAVLVHSDTEAVMLQQLAQRRGLRIPRDLAMVSYDDDDTALSGVPLTAVAPPKRILGAGAVELLVTRLRGDGGEWPVRHLTLQPTLVIRDSCGARAARR